MLAYHYLTIVLIIMHSAIGARSPFREEDPLTPEITVNWRGDPHSYTLKNSYLEEHAVFNIFNKTYFCSHLLPQGDIPFRYDATKTVKGSELIRLIEDFLTELHKTSRQKNYFKHFIVLKNRDYNPHTHAGLIVLKFKKYPFVVKLFIETPKSFVLPFSKGVEPSFQFILGKGVSRHGIGFTRIPNLEEINKKIKADPYWSTRADTPRKWFFCPKNCQWLEINGKNIGNKPTISIAVPGMYGVICDAIEPDPHESMYQQKNRNLAIKLARDFDCPFDPHSPNFMIEKSTKKIIIIDTEHFPTMVGLDEPFHFSNYGSYYIQLSQKYARDALLQTKRNRRDAQKKPASAFRRSIIDTQLHAPICFSSTSSKLENAPLVCL